MSRNRVTTNTVLLAVMRSRFSENRERKKSDKSEGFKTNAVVSVFLKEMRRGLRNIYLFFFGLR